MQRKVIIILVLVVVIIGLGYFFSQINFGPQNTWFKVVGKDFFHVHFEKVVRNDEDKTYIASGYERGVKLSEYKMFFSQINQDGKIIWSKILDSNSDKKVDSLTFSDGVFENNKISFTGWIWIENESQGAKEIPFIKIKSSGEIITSKIFGLKNGRVIGYSVDKTKDDGFIISGTVFYTNEVGNGNSDALLIKTDSQGKIEWAKTFDQDNLYDLAYSVISVSDGSFLVVGRSADQEGGEEFGARHFFNKETAFLMKIDNKGNILWQKVFDGNLGQVRLTIAKELKDNNFLVIGETYSYPENLKSQIFIAKINQNGEFIWSKMPEIDNFYQGCSVVEDKDGDLIISTAAGKTIGGIGGAFKPVLMKMNKENGAILWLKIFNRPGNGIFFDVSNSFYEDYILIVGKSNSFNKNGYDQAIIGQFNKDGELAKCQFLKDKKPSEVNVIDFTPQFKTQILKEKEIKLQERDSNLILKDFILDEIFDVCPQ
mgnify:FL=1